ncbi:hypothetical protein BN2537_4137 [Streptomyces venezuelae]|nr:hypothetical protein BN2537_4137 [Streptomyces venezuelae]
MGGVRRGGTRAFGVRRPLCGLCHENPSAPVRRPRPTAGGRDR